MPDGALPQVLSYFRQRLSFVPTSDIKGDRISKSNPHTILYSVDSKTGQSFSSTTCLTTYIRSLDKIKSHLIHPGFRSSSPDPGA